MEVMSLVGIVLAVIGVTMVIFLQIATRLEKTRAESRELSMRTELIAEKTAEETSAQLEVIANRLQRLETSTDLELIAEERVQSLENRLGAIEKTLESFKNKSLEVTSLEYQFLIFEMDRLTRDLKEDLRRQHDELIERQRKHESDLDRRIDTFRTIFTISLTVVAIIIAGLGIVIFFIG